MRKLKKSLRRFVNIPPKEPPRRPMWTDDPVRDEMAYQNYLEECRDYDESYDDGYADYWEER